MSEDITNEHQKTSYFANLAKRYKSFFIPHRTKGETLGQEPNVWRNVSEHCLVAGAFAELLCDELEITGETKKAIIGGLILHDWRKKHESKEVGEARKNGTLSLQLLEQIKERDTSELREMGYSESTIKLTGANVPENIHGPQTLQGKIVWYIDAMLSNTDAVPISERFNNLETGWDGKNADQERAKRNIAFSDLYKERYGMSMYELQRRLAEKIGDEFAKLLGYGGKIDELPIYLKQKLTEKISKS